MKSPLSKATRPAAKRRRTHRPQLEHDTPLVALAAARTVVEERGAVLKRPLPETFARQLARRAREHYAHSPHFRRRLRASGNRGRDNLHAFMHHWLDALLAEHPLLSLEDELTATVPAAHKEIIASRLADYRAGKSIPVPHADLMQKLRAK